MTTDFYENEEKIFHPTNPFRFMQCTLHNLRANGAKRLSGSVVSVPNPDNIRLPFCQLASDRNSNQLLILNHRAGGGRLFCNRQAHREAKAAMNLNKTTSGPSLSIDESSCISIKSSCSIPKKCLISYCYLDGRSPNTSLQPTPWNGV